MAKTKGKRAEDHRVKGSKEKLSLMGGGFSNMSYKDVKRRAIVLGMPFPEAVEADFGRLASFVQKSTNAPDTSLLDKYDDWVDGILEERGYDKNHPMRSYQLRLGYLGEERPSQEGSEETPLKPRRNKKKIKGLPQTKKPKREYTSSGLVQGTKKAYTEELVNKGFSLDRVTRRVLQKFPEANENTVKIWYRKFSRAKKNEQNTPQE